MQEEISQLRREIHKTRQYLNSLEARLADMQLKSIGKTEEERIARLELEFQKKYPNLKVDRRLLALVGTLPYVPASKDKETVRHIIAERYG